MLHSSSDGCKSDASQMIITIFEGGRGEKVIIVGWVQQVSLEKAILGSWRPSVAQSTYVYLELLIIFFSANGVPR